MIFLVTWVPRADIAETAGLRVTAAEHRYEVEISRTQDIQIVKRPTQKN